MTERFAVGSVSIEASAGWMQTRMWMVGPQEADPCNVVDVAVSEDDLLHRDAALLDGIEDARHFTAGVDDGTHLALVVPDQRAVLLERCDGNDHDLKL